MREAAARLGKPLSFHEENPAFIKNNGVNAGKAAEYYGIGGSDRRAEIWMVERDLALAEGTGAEVSIQHISTKEAVELVREAKKTNPHIHAEATPHHFTLTEEAAITYGALAKMNPASGRSGQNGDHRGIERRDDRYDRYRSCAP